jgi:hypothetical protein
MEREMQQSDNQNNFIGQYPSFIAQYPPRPNLSNDI